MLKELLTLMDESHTVMELTERLRTSPAVIQSMIHTLEQRQYIQFANVSQCDLDAHSSEQAVKCAACLFKASCHVDLNKYPANETCSDACFVCKTWRLTEKGRQSKERFSK